MQEDQRKGRMPIVALELLAFLLLQLVFNCAKTKFGQTLCADCIRRTQKSCQKLFLYEKESEPHHGIRWRRRVSSCKRSIKMFVFMMLIVRTEAMEAGSPGSIGAEMQPIPEDGLGMTPTSDILTQLVHNSRVTTNAISQLALTSSASTSSPGAYESTLSKALEGAVKMLGRCILHCC